MSTSLSSQLPTESHFEAEQVAKRRSAETIIPDIRRALCIPYLRSLATSVDPDHLDLWAERRCCTVSGRQRINFTYHAIATDMKSVEKKTGRM